MVLNSASAQNERMISASVWGAHAQALDWQISAQIPVR
jgi:hypothetical protein